MYYNMFVEEAEQLNSDLVLLTFDKKIEIQPGQFGMVWVPGTDEIPISFFSENQMLIEKKGEATEALYNTEPGTHLRINGPLGNGFPNYVYTAVAGGLGIAPIRSLIEKGWVRELLYGTRTKSQILPKEILIPGSMLLSEHMVQYSTDDGSFEHHGFVTDLLEKEEFHGKERFAICGPPKMMIKTASMLEQAVEPDRIYLSIESYMKCGMGICDSCECGGLKVCKDGPVFTWDKLKENKAFGEYIRGPAGSILKI